MPRHHSRHPLAAARALPLAAANRPPAAAAAAAPRAHPLSLPLEQRLLQALALTGPAGEAARLAAAVAAEGEGEGAPPRSLLLLLQLRLAKPPLAPYRLETAAPAAQLEQLPPRAAAPRPASWALPPLPLLPRRRQQRPRPQSGYRAGRWGRPASCAELGAAGGA